MDPVLLLSAALRTATLVTRSIEAAQNGDQLEADRLLALAQQAYATASEDWDDFVASLEPEDR